MEYLIIGVALSLVTYYGFTTFFHGRIREILEGLFGALNHRLH